MKAMLTLFAILFSSNYSFGDPNDVSENEKRAIIDRVIQSQRKIESLYVAFKTTAKRESKKECRQEEWAFSGEKKYLKTGFFSEVGTPANDRVALGVWDGKYYKLYDSGFNNGSVRDKYDPSDPKNPFNFANVYSRFFGTGEVPGIAQLLEKNPIKQWQVEFIEPGSKVCLSCNLSEAGTVKWYINLDKNCLIEKFEQSSKNLNTGEIVAVLELVVSESKEIEPGIWLPMRAHESGKIFGRKYENHLEVEKLIINKPEIEKVFDFEFPKKCFIL